VAVLAVAAVAPVLVEEVELQDKVTTEAPAVVLMQEAVAVVKVLLVATHQAIVAVVAALVVTSHTQIQIMLAVAVALDSQAVLAPHQTVALALVIIMLSAAKQTEAAAAAVHGT
jgi:hypothetical protein